MAITYAQPRYAPITMPSIDTRLIRHMRVLFYGTSAVFIVVVGLWATFTATGSIDAYTYLCTTSASPGVMSEHMFAFNAVVFSLPFSASSIILCMKLGQRYTRALDPDRYASRISQPPVPMGSLWAAIMCITTVTCVAAFIGHSFC